MPMLVREYSLQNQNFLSARVTTLGKARASVVSN
jgi:hypothetical protein